MNQLGTKHASAVVNPQNTKELIQTGVSENTLRAYRRALLELDRSISDAGNNFRLTERAIKGTNSDRDRDPIQILKR